MVVFITRIVVRANELKLNGESGKKKLLLKGIRILGAFGWRFLVS